MTDIGTSYVFTESRYNIEYLSIDMSLYLKQYWTMNLAGISM